MTAAGQIQSQRTTLRKRSFESRNQHHVDDTMKTLRSLRYQGYASKPWLDAEGNLLWHWFRMRTAAVIFSQYFEMCMGSIILGNLGLIMYETDQDARCYPDYADDLFDRCPYRSEHISWLQTTNLIILLLYSLECLVRLYVERGLFFCNRWNLIDVLIVAVGWLGMVLSDTVNINLLRMSRLIRISRAVRLLISVPEFYLLITGLYSSIKAIVFGAMMLLAVLVIWAVISVQLLHPITSLQDYPLCPRCAQGFGSVAKAALTLFQQIVAGDSWGTINVPLVEAAPWTMVLLFAMMTISLGVLNLILAVIVERAAEARENDHEEKIKQKQVERAKSMEELARLCASMDLDNNGLISLAEMQRGYDDVEQFSKLMEVMDIKRDDMETVFSVMAHGPVEEVSYLDFCQNISSFFKRDPVIMQSLVKYSVLEIRKLLKEEVLTILNEHTAMLEALLPGWQSQRARSADTAASSVGIKQTEIYASADGWSERSDETPDKALRVAVEREDRGVAYVAMLQSIHEQLQPLLARAEEAALSALEDPSCGDFTVEPPRTVPTSREGPKAEVPVSERRRPDEDLQEIAESHHARLERLRAGFQKRANEAERVQQKCRSLADVLHQKRRSHTQGVDGSVYTVAKF